LFPNLYLWLVFVASIDIILTRLVLFFSGTEMNPIAALVIKWFGIPGMSVFKFSVVAFVVIVCEFIGRVRWSTARNLAIFAVAASAFPVVWSCVLIMSMIINDDIPPIETDPALHKKRAVEYPRGTSDQVVMQPPTTPQQEGQPWLSSVNESELSFWAAASVAHTSPRS
ncbi:MAG: DUF5658 family protein, partial [Phycisphaerales bacterium]|nr:DUF5658 family protein [Phycisphaerales bacterium]